MPLRFEDEESYHTDYPVDLLDLCLELGVPVADPSDDGSLDLRTWATAVAKDGEARPRNPAYVVADLRFGPLVAAAVARAFDDDDFVKVAPAMVALTEARRAYLLEKTREVAQGFHPTIAAAVESLQEEVPEATLREFPEAMARLRAVDLAPRLAAQLRAGVFDEWAWPAWDAALVELGGDDPDDVWRSGVWPYLVLHDTRQAIVLGPQGEHFRHVFRLPAKARLRRTLFADGQLLVVFRDKGHDTKAYWSGKPADTFDFSDEYELPRGEGAGVLLADGSLSLGGRAVRVGDTKVESDFPVFGDQAGVWLSLDDQDDEDDDGNPKPPDGLPRLQELNPATGERRRRSWPAVMAPLAPAGWELRVDASCLLPAPPGLSHSPLGLRDGLVGCTVRRATDLGATGDRERYHLRRIDGIEWMGDVEEAPVGLLAVHGTELWHYVVENGPTGNLHLAATGELLENLDDDAPLPGVWTRIPPRACWHYLAARDAVGSRRLRQLDDDTARHWLDLAGIALTATGGKAAEPGAELATAVGAFLGTAGSLAMGVAHWALRYARLAAALRKVTDGAQAEQGDDTLVLLTPRVDDDGALAAFGKVAHDSRYASEDLTQQIGAVVRLLEGPNDQPPKACAQSDLAWFGWLGHLRALAFRLTGVYGDDEARGPGVRVFEALLQTPLVDDLQLRICNLRVKDPKLPWLLRDADDDDDDDEPSFANAWTFAVGGHRYLVRNDNWWDEDDGIELQLLEVRGDLDWETPVGATLAGDGDIVVHTAGGERGWLQAFLALLADHGAPTWDIAVPAALAERAGMAPAVAALLWAGLPRFNEWAHDFLGKELREKLGVKLPEAAKAKEALAREDDDSLRQLYGAAAAGDPAELWAPLAGDAGPVDRMAAAWKATHTAHDAALAELLAQVNTALPDLNDADGALAAMVNPAGSPVLTTHAQWYLDRDGDPMTKAEGATLDADLLVDCARLLAWLATQLPAGHSARKVLPLALAKLRERLRNPDLLLPIGRWDTESPKDAKALKALVKSLGGQPYALPAGDDEDEPAKAFDTGRLVYLLGEDYADFALRPAHVQTLAADDLVFKLAEHCYCSTDYLPAALAFLLSDDAAALAERAAHGPVADGGWEMDPRQSAPDVVDAAAHKLGLPRDAAALYLQLLSLAEPTLKNLQTWNGQTAAQVKGHLQVLRDSKLVLQAKRPRAGREDFLPGGWDARKAPDLPLETWKVPLYWQGEAPPLGRVLALRPLHQIFAQAWARVRAGEVPRYG